MKIRYAIVGFGKIAEERIIKEGFSFDRSRFSPSHLFDLVGLTDKNKEKKVIAKNLNLKWFDSLDDIINDNSIDGVVVCTNNSSHADIALPLIKAGKHCIIEKPIATNLRQAEMLQQEANKKVSLAVDHMMLHNVYNLEALRQISIGSLGEIKELNLHIEFFLDQGWRCEDTTELGGPIGDTGSHCFYIAEMLAKSPIKELSCTFLPKTVNIKSENGGYIRFKCINGILGTIQISFNKDYGTTDGVLSNMGYEVYGEKGILRAFGTLGQLSGHKDEPYPVRLIFEDFSSNEYSKRFQEIVPTFPIKNIYQSVIEQHAKSILDNKYLQIQPAIHNLELILSAYNSARCNGKTITIN